jgi:hypothetical protein
MNPEQRIRGLLQRRSLIILPNCITGQAEKRQNGNAALDLSLRLAGWGWTTRCAATDHSLNARAAFCTTTGTTAGFAWLFVKLTSPHFFLDTGVLNQLPKPFNGVVDTFVIAQPQLDHTILLSDVIKKDFRSAANTRNRRASRGESVATPHTHWKRKKPINKKPSVDFHSQAVTVEFPELPFGNSAESFFLPRKGSCDDSSDRKHAVVSTD